MVNYLFPRPIARNTFRRYAVTVPIGIKPFLQARLDYAFRSVLEGEPVTDLTADELLILDGVLDSRDTIEDLEGHNLIVPGPAIDKLTIFVHEQINAVRYARVSLIPGIPNLTLLRKLSALSISIFRPTLIVNFRPFGGAD